MSSIQKEILKPGTNEIPTENLLPKNKNPKEKYPKTYHEGNVSKITSRYHENWHSGPVNYTLAGYYYAKIN